MAIATSVESRPRAADVAKLLDLVEPHDRGFSSGVEWAYRNGVYVAPPVEGWTFAIGAGILALRDTGILLRLSEALRTEVQWFATHRGSEAHAWARFVDGDQTRRFEFASDEVLLNEGAPTPVELSLSEIGWAIRAAARTSAYDESTDTLKPGPRETTVMTVAGGWSMDPQTIEPVLEERLGVAGMAPWWMP